MEKLVAPFDLFEFMIELDALIFFEENSDKFLVLSIENGIDALYFSTSNQLELVSSFLKFVAFNSISLVCSRFSVPHISS